MRFGYTGSKGSVKKVAYSGIIMIGQISLEEDLYDIKVYKAQMFRIGNDSIKLPSVEACEKWIQQQYDFWLEMADLQEKSDESIS